VNENRIAKFEYQARSVWLIGFFAIFEVAMLYSVYQEPMRISLWLIVAALLFVSFNVSSVLVQADREIIVVSFGLGLIQKTIYVSEISRLKMRKNNTVYAIFSGASEQALEITERSGRKTNIGIGETRKMLEFFRGQVRGE
jgi:hypothetical protein